ncbi:MAG: 16S rRNA (cytosine(1402)-N(4))-methyltransferase RsmH [Kiritimatiellae bacterium]|nr:16S rRNA (cytosine(1402)-N(4))-methyltransferase RsmH [Kiritimatiellia bacterium]
MDVRAAGTYVDATVGSGGHAEAILQRLGAEGRLLGIDRDEEALERTRKRLEKWSAQCVLAQGNYAEMAEIAARFGFEKVDGVLLDLGVSSEQIETPERGFSFRLAGPLDMRMDRGEKTTAADLVNGLEEDELRRLLWVLGEETAARRIARAIVRERDRAPIADTCRLAEIVERARGWRGRVHPATKTFQAFRMAVNRELENLDEGLKVALDLLRERGRLAVITFHSLEDRRVKSFMARHAGHWESLPAGGRRWIGEEPAVKRVTRKPVVPEAAEIGENPRSRSAKLRVAERLSHGAQS